MEEEVSDILTVVAYIQELSGRSQINYADYELIKEWVNLAGDLDRLLLVLSETLTAPYRGNKDLGTVAKNLKSLKMIHKKVKAQLSIKI